MNCPEGMGKRYMNHYFNLRMIAILSIISSVITSACGCSKQTVFPVSGTLVDMEGKPITEMKGGAVEFEALDGKSSANGGIDEHGKFRLTSKTPGDGAELGKYRVVVTRPYVGPENPVPHVILPKYEKHESSGLEVTVEPKDNVIELKVERVKRN